MKTPIVLLFAILSLSVGVYADDGLETQDEAAIGKVLIQIISLQGQLESADAQHAMKTQPTRNKVSELSREYSARLTELREKYGKGENCSITVPDLKWRCEEPDPPEESDNE